MPPQIVVPTTAAYGDPLSGKLRGVALDQGSPAWLRLTFDDAATGGPVTFANADAATVQVKYREATGTCPVVWVPDSPDTPTLAADGTYALLPVPQEVKDGPGVYEVQARVLDAGGVEQARDSFWVLVQRGLWNSAGSSPTQDVGPPTLREVRLALRDHPAANRLLGEYEFDAAEVGQAVVSAISYFNSDFPVGTFLNSRTWPAAWKRNLLDGAVSYLLETATNYFRRGSLPYAAGGISVNDLAKDKDYGEAIGFYKTRFERWVKVEKARQSLANSFGSQGSGIPWTFGGRS